MATRSPATRKQLHIALAPRGFGLVLVEYIMSFLDDRCQLCATETGMEVKDQNREWQWWCLSCFVTLRDVHVSDDYSTTCVTFRQKTIRSEAAVGSSSNRIRTRQRRVHLHLG